MDIFFLEAFTLFIVLLIQFFDDFSSQKDLRDESNENYSLSKDYIPQRWENIIKKWCYSVLGALLASEVGMYAIDQFFPLQGLPETGIDLTIIAVCAFFAPKLFVKK